MPSATATAQQQPKPSAQAKQPQQLTPRLLTVTQAAQYCSATVWSIRTLVWSKELPACVIGRRLLIDRSDIDTLIDKRLSERAQ
jgi:excisionase family DNA binding protein